MWLMTRGRKRGNVVLWKTKREEKKITSDDEEENYIRCKLHQMVTLARPSKGKSRCEECRCVIFETETWVSSIVLLLNMVC
eukprot:jgi/Botrbrau1/9799/Bobra.0322s0007.1